MDEDGGSQFTTRLIEEWPAVLAVIVLALTHVYLTIFAGEDVTPFGLPLIAAIVVFLVAELGRRLV